MGAPVCIFCKIASGAIPSAKVWEDERYLAFLDINPNVRGMTLVITKEHYDSYAFAMPEETYVDFLAASRTVARLLDAKLGVRRTAMVMEGMGVNHAHIKLYPLHGLAAEFEEMWGPDRVFFEDYPGYVTTLLGPQADSAELDRLAAAIRA